MPTSDSSDSVSTQAQAHSAIYRVIFASQSQATTSTPQLTPRGQTGIFSIALLIAEPHFSRKVHADIHPVTSTALPLFSRDHSDITSKRLPQGRNRFLTFRASVLFTLFSAVLAATDCEILNSGFPAISASECCDIEGITCENNRVVEM
jgi:hypothetical protein